MPGSSIATVPGGGTRARVVHPLPEGIPILEGGARRAPRRPIVFIIILGLVGLIGFRIWTVFKEKQAEVQRIAALSEAATKRNNTRSQPVVTHTEAASKRSAADEAKIKQTLAPMLLVHMPKADRIPVKLANGFRIFQIESSVVHYRRGRPPTTCVTLSVTDPTTGAKETPEVDCVVGLDYPIKQQ